MLLFYKFKYIIYENNDVLTASKIVVVDIIRDLDFFFFLATYNY